MPLSRPSLVLSFALLCFGFAAAKPKQSKANESTSEGRESGMADSVKNGCVKPGLANCNFGTRIRIFRYFGPGSKCTRRDLYD